jgi:hypothetical protein
VKRLPILHMETFFSSSCFRIVAHDLCSDAHGWNGGKLTLDTDLVTLLSERINPGVESIAIILDSLSPLLLHQTPQYTCQTINSLAYRNLRKGAQLF